MAKQKKQSAKDGDKPDMTYQFEPSEFKLYEKRKKRFEKMYKKKQKLGVDEMCDRFDALFTPHLITFEDPNATQIQSNIDLLSDKLFNDKSRKSMPIFFEKVTTALSLLIKENPKCIMKPFSEQYRETDLLVQHALYDNFAQQRKKEVLKKYVYQLAKYGIAFWREYIKKTYRKQHELNPNGLTTVKWVYDIFDVVAEVIHPKMVILDNNCYSVKDVNKPAVDCIIQDYLSQDEFEATYPVEQYEKAEYVKEGMSWMLTVSGSTYQENEGQKSKIQILIYENRYENLRETWANGVPLESIPLPGDDLSLSGDKWVEDRENYIGIGLGHVIELYQPIIDDIVNASLERLRQIVRPNEDWFNGVEETDESEDVLFGSGSVRKFTGNSSDIKYQTPPTRSDSEVREKEEVMEEIDRSTGVPRNLSGSANTASRVKTAYQDAMMRESALQKFNLPLTSIKKTLEDAANLDLGLYKLAYSVPYETIELELGDEDFDEGISILNQAKQYGIEDERVMVPDGGVDAEGNVSKIIRRKFRTMHAPIKMIVEKNGEETTGRTKIVESDELNFWENIPKHFNWKGRVEIIGESFLPVSKSLQDTQDKETIEYLMNVPTTDDQGKPNLTDAAGKPYTIDKVRLLKERCRMNDNFDPDKFIVPLSTQNQGQGNLQNQNPLESSTDLSASNQTGIQRPETGNLKP